MSYVSVLPATLATAATEVARIGSALSLASAVAAAQTSAVQAAAADEVSAASVGCCWVWTAPTPRPAPTRCTPRSSRRWPQSTRPSRP
ncbi:PE domain-containing protein [Mycobacterium tuberculosis]|uniref:PE domain-containing protein n=1 Tax=Mycobacterium tuberculosis TaxID=1773 RepID=UPI003C6D7839